VWCWCSRRKVRRVRLKIWQNKGAFIFPSKIHMPVAPFLLIPAETWTFVGCLGRGLGRGLSPSFRQQYLLSLSNWILASSVQITSSKFSWRFLWAHSSHFSRFTLLISWQYAEPQYTHPNWRLFRRIVVNETWTLKVARQVWSCVAVVSSSYLIQPSINCRIAGDNFKVMPVPGFLPI